MTNWNPIVCAQWLGYCGPKGAPDFFVFEECIVKYKPESMAQESGSLSIMLRGIWIRLCILDNIISINCMPEITIQVSVFLNSLPIIDGV